MSCSFFDILLSCDTVTRSIVSGPHDIGPVLFSKVATAYFLITLVLAGVCDLRYRSVPAHLERACFFFAVAGAFEKALPLFILKLSGSAFCFLLFFVLYVISKGKGIGGADVRIFAGSCAVLGFFPTFEALLIGSCLGLFYLITHHRFPNAPKTTIPLITFFALGCFVSKSLSSSILHMLLQRVLPLRPFFTAGCLTILISQTHI